MAVKTLLHTLLCSQSNRAKLAQAIRNKGWLVNLYLPVLVMGFGDEVGIFPITLMNHLNSVFCCIRFIVVIVISFVGQG